MPIESSTRYLFAAARGIDEAHAIIDQGGGTFAYGDQELGDLLALALDNARVPVVVNCGEVPAGDPHGGR